MEDRRTGLGYKLRVYVDAIREVKSMTLNQWIDSQVGSSEPYRTKEMWLSYLESCAVIEAVKLSYIEAA